MYILSDDNRQESHTCNQFPTLTVVTYELQPIGAFSSHPPAPLTHTPKIKKKNNKKTDMLADLGWRNHRVMFQAQMQAGTLDEELTSTQYIVVKTSYIDMSSRFTAPHCFCCYQAINSRAGMNWLTLRVASVASCNLIPYIISPSCFYFSFPDMFVVKLNQHICSFF